MGPVASTATRKMKRKKPPAAVPVGWWSLQPADGSRGSTTQGTCQTSPARPVPSRTSSGLPVCS